MHERGPFEGATEGATADGRAGKVEPAQVAERYLLLDHIGEGGSADVYTAFDRTLDRKIALKLLRDPGGQERLLREAQALARLRHPNVVQVYDCGALGDRVFLAMELVAGGTLRAWLEERRRAWREVLAAFVAAGRGLAAIHAAGLVHRDFKPDNVLVDSDGTVRVADLGLVRLSDPTAVIAPGSEALSPLVVHVTHTRGIVGTPRYMAPEHHAGHAVTASGDQFSFCAALYLGLFHHTAFAGDTLEEIKANVEAGRVQPPPAGHKVPAWLLRAVKRGLATRAEDRWPSMDALLVELTRDRGRVIGRVVAGAALAAVGVGLVVAFTRETGPPVCAGAASRLAGVWDPARRAAVERAFAGSQRSYAAAAFARSAELLDGYTTAWVAMRDDTCRATAVRHEQSEALLDMRMACLDRRLLVVGHLVDLFAARPDDAIVDRAVTVVDQLEPLAGCADQDRLLAAVPPPSDPAVAARVASLLAQVDQAAVLNHAGKFQEAEARMVAVVAEARLLGHPPLLATAILELTSARLELAHAQGVRQLAGEGLRAAVAARDARVESFSWIALIKVALLESQLAQAIDYGVGAEGAIQRAGDPADLRALAHHLRALAFFRQDRNPEALESVTLGIALGEAARLPASQLGSMFELRGLILLDEDRLAEAIAEFERCAAAAAKLGEDHPFRADPLLDLGAARARAGDTAGARAALTQSLAIFERAYGPHHVDVGTALSWLAYTANREQSYVEAEAFARRAVAIKESVLGRDGYSLPNALDALGVALDHLGRSDEAGQVLERALALRRKLHGDGGADIATNLLLIADHHRHAGRQGEAASAADRALATLETNHIRDRMDRLIILAEVRLDQHRAADALLLLDRAAAVAQPGPDQHRLTFARARAHWELGRDRVAAVQDARAVLAKVMEQGNKGWLGAEVRAWLAAR